MSRIPKLSIILACAALAACSPREAPAPSKPAKQVLIQLDEPQPGASVSSPLTLRGTARGPWFFEASFPVTVVDAAGATLGQGYAQAQGEWMTEDFVPFTATVSFNARSGARGQLVLHKANASGLPEHDDRLVVPVLFR